MTVTAWWQTSVIPPDPQSDSVILIDHQQLTGLIAISLPDVVPPQAAFVTVQVDDAVHAFRAAAA